MLVNTVFNMFDSSKVTTMIHLDIAVALKDASGEKECQTITGQS